MFAAVMIAGRLLAACGGAAPSPGPTTTRPARPTGNSDGDASERRLQRLLEAVRRGEQDSGSRSPTPTTAATSRPTPRTARATACSLKDESKTFFSKLRRHRQLHRTTTSGSAAVRRCSGRRASAIPFTSVLALRRTTSANSATSSVTPRRRRSPDRDVGVRELLGQGPRRIARRCDRRQGRRVAQGIGHFLHRQGDRRAVGAHRHRRERQGHDHHQGDDVREPSDSDFTPPATPSHDPEHLAPGRDHPPVTPRRNADPG